jgi:hypothetical protein
MNAAILRHRTIDGGSQRRTSEKILIAIEIFNGLSALAGGMALTARPNGAILHMPTSYLAGSPFSDYFIPGVLLTVFVGGGMLGAALLLVWHRTYAVESAMITGVALVIFEIVEFSIIGFNPMQVLYGGLGAVVLGFAAHSRFVQTRTRKHTSG